MKKETRIRKFLNKTSFRTQLFIIILVSFILFEVVAYLAITLTLRNVYTNDEIETSTEAIKKLSNEINKKENSLIRILNKYQLESGNTILVLNNSTGGFLLEDYETYSYVITSEDDKEYVIPSLDVLIEVGDSLELSYKETEDDNRIIVRKIKKSGVVIYQEPFLNLKTDEIVVSSISIPENLNYLYISGSKTVNAINILDTKYNDFIDMDIDGGIIKYYTDSSTSSIYIILKSDELDSITRDGTVIYIVSPFVPTKSLINTTSITFIFIVLASLGIAILIAVFISNAFSNPIRLFEKEMLKLKENNYRKTNFGFRNKEMISLENSLNEVKFSIKQAVESVKKQSKKLERLNNELLNEEELRSSFVQRLSHELKTPLMIISATTEALESGLIEKDNINQSYETILSEVDKTTEIIKEIITNYKNQSEKNSLKKELFNLNELVLEVVNPLMPLAKTNELNVKLNLGDVCYMEANKEMIKNVISNFVTNAIKYTPKNNDIEINIIEDEQSYLFEVLNYGAHINEENIDKIWLPFFREKEDVDSASTGMGLYIVKTTLESHKLEYDVCNFDKGVRSYFIIKK